MDEIQELDRLREYNEYDMNLDFTSYVAKVVILLQANISRAQLRVSSLISDTMFIMQVSLFYHIVIISGYRKLRNPFQHIINVLCRI